MRKMIVNEFELNFSIMEDGRSLPRSCEILEQVGLAAISEVIDKFYDLLGVADPLEFLQWVSYMADVNVFQAKVRVTKYLLLDGGCRMCSGTTEQIRVDEFNWLRDQLSMLEDEKIYSFKEVAEMLNEIGFNIILQQDENETERPF